MGKVASAVGLDNGLLLASVVWLNIVKKKKRESSSLRIITVRA